MEDIVFTVQQQETFAAFMVGLAIGWVAALGAGIGLGLKWSKREDEKGL